MTSSVFVVVWFGEYQPLHKVYTTVYKVQYSASDVVMELHIIAGTLLLVFIARSLNSEIV